MTETQIPTHYLTLQELAVRWSVHINTVRNLTAGPEWLGAVTTIVVGSQIRCLEADVLAWEHARRVTAERPASEFGACRKRASRKAA